MLHRALPVLFFLAACQGDADEAPIEAGALIRASHRIAGYTLDPQWNPRGIGRLRLTAMDLDGEPTGELDMWREDGSDRGAIALWFNDTVTEAHMLGDETAFYVDGDDVPYDEVEDTLAFAAAILKDRSVTDHLAVLGATARAGCPWWVVGIDNARTSICAWSYLR